MKDLIEIKKLTEWVLKSYQQKVQNIENIIKYLDVLSSMDIDTIATQIWEQEFEGWNINEQEEKDFEKFIANPTFRKFCNYYSNQLLELQKMIKELI